MMRKLLLAVGAVALIGAMSTAVIAADPIADRKAAMKSVGGAVKAAGDLLGGTFDGAKAAEAMVVISGVAKGLPDMFPAGSEAGGETTASPKIWEQMDAFKAASAKLGADADAAGAAAATGKDAFAAAFGTLTGNCKSCHEAFRVAK